MVGKEVDRAAQSAAPKAMRHLPAQEVVTVRDRRDVVHQSSIGLGKPKSVMIRERSRRADPAVTCNLKAILQKGQTENSTSFRTTTWLRRCAKFALTARFHGVPSDRVGLGQRVKPPSMMLIVPVVKV